MKPVCIITLLGAKYQFSMQCKGSPTPTKACTCSLYWKNHDQETEGFWCLRSDSPCVDLKVKLYVEEELLNQQSFKIHSFYVGPQTSQPHFQQPLYMYQYSGKSGFSDCLGGVSLDIGLPRGGSVCTECVPCCLVLGIEINDAVRYTDRLHRWLFIHRPRTSDDL